MMRGKILTGIIMVLLFNACQKDVIDKYEEPEWLDGKVFTQIQKHEDLSTFKECLEITGYDTVINVSGSYTVFAPTNAAFTSFFEENPQYSSVEDIPVSELSSIVRYHILQNPWSKKQLRSLDINGWIDEDDQYNNKPRGFKRETLLLDKDVNYGVKVNPDDIDKLIIVDSTASNWHRRVNTDSRKFAPLFYQEYFSIYNLNLTDYSFYFDRNFDNADDLYYVNAKVADDDIFAENGFVYKIDKVVSPLRNANEILSANKGGNSYSKFLNLINQFPVFSYNEDKTFDQAGAEQGLQVDSLFDLSYPELTFNISNELTKAPTGANSDNFTIRFHHGLTAPTNEAFDQFVQQYVAGDDQWGSIEEIPEKVKRIIANSYLSINPIYETDINEGFYNGELDIVNLNTDDIVEKEFGSNCTFIGLKSPIIPRALKSVTGPVYLQPGYRTLLNAIEYSGVLAPLKKQDKDIALFVLHDFQLNRDSSLFYTKIKNNNQVFERFTAITVAPSLREYTLAESDLRNLLLNHATIQTPLGIASVEFLQTLSGNHIIWNNLDGTVQGTQGSTFGFRGSEPVSVRPRQLGNLADNGTTYEINSWLNFKNEELFSVISKNFPEFHSLIVKSGLAQEKQYRYSFISENKQYTVFAPSAQALIDIQADTLTGESLNEFIQLHFIEDNLIFTDGKLNSGYYPSVLKKEIAGTFQKVKVEIFISPDIDNIRIHDNSGNDFTTIIPFDKSNFISSKLLDENADALFPSIVTTSVIHKIDKAFEFKQLDIKQHTN